MSPTNSSSEEDRNYKISFLILYGHLQFTNAVRQCIICTPTVNKLHTLIPQKKQLHCKDTTHYLFLKHSDETADLILFVVRKKKLFQIRLSHTESNTSDFF